MPSLMKSAVRITSIFCTASLLLAVPLAAQWTPVDSAPAQNSWNAVTHGSGGFVAVNGFGRIATSTDGGRNFSETGNFSGNNVIFDDVRYGMISAGASSGSNGYLAVGTSGSTNYIYESLDGQSWTDVTANYGPYFAGTKVRNVGVGAGNSLTIGASNSEFGHAIYDGSGFTAMGKFGFDAQDIYTSNDGETYTRTTSDYAFEANGGLYTGSGFLLVGTDRPNPRVAATAMVTDFSGTPTINVIAGTTGYLSAVVDANGTYVAVGGSDNFTDMNAFSSIDGTSWTRDTHSGSGNAFFDLGDIAYDGSGNLVAVGAYGIVQRSLSAVPEPGSAALWLGVISFCAIAQRRRRTSR
ncbi:MAG: hypothetical protein SynsKO_39550 [Synoicihabitans sp.]